MIVANYHGLYNSDGVRQMRGRASTGDSTGRRRVEADASGNEASMDLIPAKPVPVIKAKLRTGLASLLPHTHARSLPRLRAAHPGLGPDELARRLVADTARRSAAVGAAAACCACAPVPAAAALAAAGESAATSALRTRLTTELYAAYGLLDPSPVNDGATGQLMLRAARDSRGVFSLAALPALALTTTKALPKKLRHRLPTLRTLFTASVVSAALRTGRDTRRYGEALRDDLRSDPTAWSRWPDEAADVSGPQA